MTVRDLLIRAVDLPGMRACIRFDSRSSNRLFGRLATTVILRSSVDHVFRLIVKRALVSPAYDNQLTETTRRRNGEVNGRRSAEGQAVRS